MVDGISGVNTGSIKDLPVYQQYYSEYLAHLKKYNSNISFDAYLTLEGKKEFFLQKVENYLEGGGDGVQGNTISGSRYVNNGNFSMYQSQDEDTYYEFDFNDGSYRILHGKEEAAAALGIDGENIDTLNFGRMSAQITDYTFGNLDDGQDSSTSKVSGLYNGVTYTQQEFDLDYIFNALLMNPNDPQYKIAAQIFDDLVDNMNQWCPASDLEALDEIAAEYGTNSVQYKDKLKEILLANLDQANEWIDDHSHVEYKDDVSLDSVSDSDNTGSESENNTVPDYDIDNVLTTAGLLTSYARGDTRNVESTDNSQGNRRKELEGMMDQDLTALANALASQLGDQLTTQMQTYINKAVAAVVADESLITTWSKHHSMFGMHKKTGGSYNVKSVADAFFNEFNTICQNGGKTSTEVEAEKKAAEEKAEKEKASYQTLYNMNMRSVGSEAGVKDVTVVSTSNNQYAEIQEKAQTDIITPLKNKIKEKLKNSNIPEADLERILTYAEESALSNTSAWASTSNNYTYSISSSKLIELFQDAVKSAIKSKGYDF